MADAFTREVCASTSTFNLHGLHYNLQRRMHEGEGVTPPPFPPLTTEQNKPLILERFAFFHTEIAIKFFCDIQLVM